MGTLALYGKVRLMPFLEKHFHIKLTSNGRIEDCAIYIHLFRLKRERKNKSGVLRLASSVYMPFPPHSRSVVYPIGLPGDSLTRLKDLIAIYVKQQYRCY